MATILDVNGSSCVVCDEPLTGKQVSYCSPVCKRRAKDKRRRRLSSRSMATAFTQTFYRAQTRARSRGMEFSLSRADVPPQARCSRTGIAFNPNDTLRSPSLDRIDNDLGYIPGNVEWTCWGYNLLKGNRTSRDVLEFLKDVSV